VGVSAVGHLGADGVWLSDLGGGGLSIEERLFVSSLTEARRQCDKGPLNLLTLSTQY
jgi:hypothetical protein